MIGGDYEIIFPSRIDGIRLDGQTVDIDRHGDVSVVEFHSFRFKDEVHRLGYSWPDGKRVEMDLYARRNDRDFCSMEVNHDKINSTFDYHIIAPR